MNRVILQLLLIAVSMKLSAQAGQNPTAPLDSLKELEMILNMLDASNSPTSNFDVSVGIGNKLFSQNNNSVNAAQSQVNQLYYTPSIGYQHKSGFGLSLTPFIASYNGVTKIYQTALSPFYEYTGKSIGANVSYTRYLADTKAYNSNVIFQNDWYAVVRYKKWVLEPSVAIGYTTGTFYEVSRFDTVGRLRPNIVYDDSTKNTIKDFSLLLGIEHSFDFLKLFGKADALTITPQLLLTTGSEKYSSTRTNKVIYPQVNQFLLKQAARRGIAVSRTQTDNAAFALQSLAFSLSADYSIKKFSISPNVYADYYLPETTGTRLSTVFSIIFGYYF